MRQAHLKVSWHKLHSWVTVKVIGDKAYYEHFSYGWYSYQPLDGNYDNLIVSNEELGVTIGKKTVLKEESIIAPHFSRTEIIYF